MKRSLILAALVTLVSSITHLSAQQPQIPNIFLNNESKVEGKATVHIDQRMDLFHSGDFTVVIGASCTPPAYPAGSVKMEINMSDSSIVYFESTTIEAISSTGKHTPTVFLMGKCVVKSENTRLEGCHYWIKLANNGEGEKGTPDIISFLVLDGNGKRIAYGSGPVKYGDIYVAATPN
jgi:hypothetical protein